MNCKTFVLLTSLALCLSACERAKTKLDREVDRLCAIDGGVHVYETVKLSKENFDSDGRVSSDFSQRLMKGKANGMNYQSRLDIEVLVNGDPALQRNKVSVTRISDAKVLGELITYKRSGGDAYGPWEPSQHACPPGNQPTRFYEQIFVRG